MFFSLFFVNTIIYPLSSYFLARSSGTKLIFIRYLWILVYSHKVALPRRSSREKNIFLDNKYLVAYKLQCIFIRFKVPDKQNGRLGLRSKIHSIYWVLPFSSHFHLHTFFFFFFKFSLALLIHPLIHY